MLSSPRIRLVFVGALVLGVTSSWVASADRGGAARPAPAADPQRPLVYPDTALTTAINQFGSELYGQVQGQDGNVIVSPVSTHVALSMTLVGAGGATRDELSQALHLDQLGDSAPALYRARLAAWKQLDAGPGDLKLANRLFVQRAYRLVPAFTKQVRFAYGAPAEAVDFVGHPEVARRTINRWVLGQTKHKIVDLIGDGGVTTDTRLVLVDALYFKGQWQHRFDKHATLKAGFQLADGTTQVDMMQLDTTLAYGETNDAQLVELPYKGDRLAMVIVVPKDAHGLAAIEARLSAQTIDLWVGALAPIEVALQLPRWKTRFATGLVAPLKALGITRAFAAAVADFTPLAVGPKGDNLLHIEDVFFQGFVQVDEAGAEAAAATAVGMAEPTAIAATTPVVADHPFLYFVRDRVSGEVFFLGRISDPTR